VSGFYEFIGRVVVYAMIERFRPQIRVAGALAVAATVLGLGVYLATREDDGPAS